MKTEARYPQAGALLRFFDVIDKELGDIPVDAVFFFMKVMDEPGIRMDDIRRGLGLSQTKVSRYAGQLSSEYWHQHSRTYRKGPDLIVTRPDPKEPKWLRVYLTKKGEALADRLAATVNGIRLT
jgi:DNA-binding MarR family transcriptional regulator